MFRLLAVEHSRGLERFSIKDSLQHLLDWNKYMRRMQTLCLAEYQCTHLQSLLKDGEDALNPNADPHTWHLPSLGIKHSHQTIIATTSSHAPNAD